MTRGKDEWKEQQYCPSCTTDNGGEMYLHLIGFKDAQYLYWCPACNERYAIAELGGIVRQLQPQTKELQL